jgi:flagellar basal body-associated protein FliL
LEGKSSFFTIILLIIVAFLTLTLAALAGYFFLGGSKTEIKVIENASIEIPKDEDLASLVVFGEGEVSKPEVFNLKNNDTNSIPVIQVSVELEYLIKTPKKSSIKDPAAKMEKYHGKIKQLIGTYFMNQTLQDVKELHAKEKAAEELKKQINELINENEEDKKDIVYEVIFDKWFVS